MYSWGFGEDGQLGHGEDEKFLAKPTKITRDHLNSRICQICASDFLSAALSGTSRPLHIELDLNRGVSPFRPIRRQDTKIGGCHLAFSPLLLYMSLGFNNESS